MILTALNMANSTNSNGWEDFFMNSAPLPPSLSPTLDQVSLSPISQSLDQVSLSETGDLSESQGWFSGTGNNMTHLPTIVEDNTSRRPNVQKSSNPRRNIVLYVPRSEFVKEIRGFTEKINRLQDR